MRNRIAATSESVRTQPVGNTRFVLTVLDRLSQCQAEISYNNAQRLYEAIPHTLSNHWLDVLMRCSPLFTIRDEFRTIELTPGSLQPQTPAASTQPGLASACLLSEPPLGTAATLSAEERGDPKCGLPEEEEEEASRAATPHQALS